MAADFNTSKPFCIRDLPFPAKLVITCFLLAVGGGYSAAMVQLHFQDSKSGEPMPTVHDVILKFTGKKWFETDPPRPVSKLEKLVMGPVEGAPWNGSGSMAPAFFKKDGGEYDRQLKKAPSEKAHLDAERNGEREAVALWCNLPVDVQKNAYERDLLTLDADKAPNTLTSTFKYPDGSIHIKSIIDARCKHCHSRDGAQSTWPLENYDQIAKYLSVPPTVTVKAGGDWVKIEEPIGLEKLTQSTHAHLLSFAMLFALTGLVIAFSSYPTIVRCVLGPWVLLAVVADVSLWWLARLCPDWGPYFAMGVIGTGGAAGAGLAAQITLSLWNMYGAKGRLMLGLLGVAIAGCGCLIYLNQIEPGLANKKNAINAKAEADKRPEESKQEAVVIKAPEKKNEPDKKIEPEKKEVVAPRVGVSPIERVFKYPVKDAGGRELPLLSIPFKGAQEGGMIRAFFDKDLGNFAEAVKEKDMPTQDKLMPERKGELEAFLAWTRLTDADRKKSYETDLFDLPVSLTGKPVTAEYVAGGKLKIKTLIADRCERCHTDGSDAEKYPMVNYDQIHKLLVPK